MSGWLETHRSFVNTWECDENDHMNVQFYLKRFDEAARIFRSISGKDAGGPLPKTRHVRYHRELVAGATTAIFSGAIGKGDHAGWTVHRLVMTDTGALAATAVDSGDETGSLSLEETAEALPRGLPQGHLDAMAGEAVIAAGGLVSHRCIVPPAECDATGAMMQQFYVSRFTDAAPHAWDHAGISTAWLEENGYGRVAVEMKITHHQPAVAGDILFVHSNLRPENRKLLRMRHEVIRHSDQVAVASCEVLALVLDLESRKSVPLPDFAFGGK